MKRIYGFALTLSLLFAACNNSEEETLPEPPAIPTIAYTVTKTFPHDTSSFTEGLEFHNGKLLESTGLENHSKLIRYDLATGRMDKEVKLEGQYFGEGITVLRDTVYQLTYTSGKVFMYKASDLSKIGELPFNGQGWGLTNDGQQIIATNGSANLYFYQPGTFKLLKAVEVTSNGAPVTNINELEYINGKVYANQWQSANIFQIDPATGNVTGLMDFSATDKQVHASDPHAEFMNGLAWDSATKKLYVTGKNWPNIFEVQLP